MATVYRSKLGAWLGAVLAFAVTASLSGMILALSAGSWTAGAATAATALLGVGLPAWLLLSTRYLLGHDHLVVLSGPFEWRIRLADITSITPACDPLSSPALSLDALRIDYWPGRSITISPADKERFVCDIKAAVGDMKPWRPIGA